MLMIFCYWQGPYSRIQVCVFFVFFKKVNDRVSASRCQPTNLIFKGSNMLLDERQTTNVAILSTLENGFLHSSL